MIKARGIYPYFFIAPIVIGIGIFGFYCAYEIFRLSLFESSLLSERYVGLDNYFYIFKEKWFLVALSHTLYYAIWIVPANLIIALALSGVMFGKIRGGTFFRVIYMLPWIASPVVIALTFRYIFNSEWGVVNWILVNLGFEKVAWTQSPLTAIPVVALMESWRNMGFGMILFLGAMSSIDKKCLEAAELDGASGFRKLVSIIIPQLKPTIFFYVVISLLYAFQAFDGVYAFVEGVRGAGSWHVFVSPVMVSSYYIYSTAFRMFEFGKASAMAVSLFVIVLIIIVIQKYLTRKK